MYNTINKLNDYDFAKYEQLNDINDTQYNTIYELAKEEFNNQKKKNLISQNCDFDTQNVFITNGSLHGFYFPNLRELNGVKLECICYIKSFKNELKPDSIYINHFGEYLTIMQKDININFDLNNIKIEINNTIKAYENEITALEQVQIITKKNGDPFANFGKNFKNAKLTHSYGGEGFPILTPNGTNINILLYKYCDTDKEQQNAIKTGHNIYKNGICRTTYILNFNEIANEIEKEIGWRFVAILQKKEILKNIDNEMNDLFNMIANKLSNYELNFSKYALLRAFKEIAKNFYL